MCLRNETKAVLIMKQVYIKMLTLITVQPLLFRDLYSALEVFCTETSNACGVPQYFILCMISLFCSGRATPATSCKTEIVSGAQAYNDFEMY